MKRALAALMVLGLFGFAGFAQLSGSASLFLWTDDLSTFSLYTDVSLSYTLNGWTLSTYNAFTEDGFTYSQFGIKGALGPLSLAGTLRFNPSGTDIADIVIRNDLKISVTFAGLDTGLWVFHDVVGPAGTFKLPSHRFGLRGVYCDDTWAIVVTNAEAQTSGVMVYYSWIKTEGFRMDIFFTDPSTGIELDTVMAEFMVPLCCGISAETEISFTKVQGLEWVKFKLKDLSLCCGWSFDVDVLYGIASKQVTIKPKYKGLEGCVTLYGGWDYSGGGQFTGISLHGFAVKCTLGDCSEFGALTAFAPAYFWVDEYALLGGNFPGMASGFLYRYYDTVQPLPSWWPSYYTGLFGTGETEVIWLKGCGAGCCGGKYSYEIDVFFGATGFFGIQRVRGLFSIPVASNIDISALFEVSTTGFEFLGAGISLSF
ncbi:MAG: hypothetical protein QXI12_11770 [Candidatus Methanomethyliaceae archaeon]